MKYLFKKTIANILFALYTYSGIGIIIYNFKGFVIKSNKKANKILGYKNGELKNKSFLILIPTQKIPNKLDLFEQIIFEDLKEKKYTIRSRRRKDGTEISVYNKMRSYKKFNMYISFFKEIK